MIPSHLQRDLHDEEEGDSEDELNLDEMLGDMQQLKKNGRLSTILVNPSDGAGPSSTAAATAPETTLASMVAVMDAAVTALAAASHSPMPLAGSVGSTARATGAISSPVAATTEITPAMTQLNAASVAQRLLRGFACKLTPSINLKWITRDGDALIINTLVSHDQHFGKSDRGNPVPVVGCAYTEWAEF
ncbi:unnamed protein product [Closterium sp. Yama58-4]|nr:unnamed protein product [Closterium sp. Yama58-4]